jgi:hypothetical protein
MIKTGRYGTIAYDPAGVTPVNIISLNKWKMSQKTPMQKVTCFLDTNDVYVPGMKDISGALSGFWNSSNRVLFLAVDAATPGKLALAPNSTEPTFNWSGLAYLDADIDCTVEGAPALSSSFVAAGAWVMAP